MAGASGRRCRCSCRAGTSGEGTLAALARHELGPLVLRALAEAGPEGVVPALVNRLEDDLVARPADEDLIAAEAELLRQPDRVAASVPEQLRSRAHGYWLVYARYRSWRQRA